MVKSLFGKTGEKQQLIENEQLKPMFNFYAQHELNKKRTQKLNILLALTMVLVIFIAAIIIIWATKDDGQSMGKALKGSLTSYQFWKWATIIFMVWSLGIAWLTWRVLKSPIKAVMDASGAIRVTDKLKKADPKIKLFDELVDELSIGYGIKKPLTYVVENTDEPNAFAVSGTSKDDDTGVAITRPLLDMLDKNELSGVLGHELGHIVAGDSLTTLRFALYVSSLAGITMVGLFCLRTIWALVGDDSKFAYAVSAVCLAVGVVLTVAGSIGLLCANILKFAMSRTREYDADAMSAKINSGPEGLIGALTKIDQWVENYEKDLVKSDRDAGNDEADVNDQNQLASRYASLYFVSNTTHLFDDHPSTKDRIKRLKEI